MFAWILIQGVYKEIIREFPDFSMIQLKFFLQVWKLLRVSGGHAPPDKIKTKVPQIGWKSFSTTSARLKPDLHSLHSTDAVFR